jgi:hypothetical protein
MLEIKFLAIHHENDVEDPGFCGVVFWLSELDKKERRYIQTHFPDHVGERPGLDAMSEQRCE